jgi:hypothetical protein
MTQQKRDATAAAAMLKLQINFQMQLLAGMT